MNHTFFSMTKVTLFSLLLTLTATGRAAPPATPRTLTATTTSPQALQLPPDFFPIMSWEPFASEKGYWDHPTAGIASLKECGFNTIAFVQPKHLQVCEKIGLKALTADIVGGKTWAKMSDEQVDNAVRKLIREAAKSPALLGYYIVDEPGAGQFPQLAKAVETVRRHAPGKLAYINLFPDYATIGARDISQLEAATYEEYLNGFIDVVKPQVVSYDNYRVQYSRDQEDKNVATGYYRNLLHVRSAALKNGLPFWNIVACSQIIPEGTPPSPANLLLQAYTTLAAGAQGLTWYTYYSYGYANAPVDQQMRRTQTWSYLKMVNDQLQVLGPTMRSLSSTGVCFYGNMVDGVPSTPSKLIPELQSTQPLMAGEFTGPSGSAYVMLVNLSLERSTHVKASLNTAPPLQVISPVDGTTGTFPEKGLWLTPGAGALIRVR